MRVLTQFVERVESKLTAIRVLKEASSVRFDFNRGLDKLRDPNLNRETHCAMCGLPKDKHVAHEPPDIPKPKGEAGPKEWGPYLRALDTLYRSGLQALSDAELTGMPLPISERRLRGIAAEAKVRLEKAPPSRWARIGSDEDDL